VPEADPIVRRFEDIEPALAQLASTQRLLLHKLTQGNVIERPDRQIDKITDASRTSERMITEIAKRIAEIAVIRKHSDERLSALRAFVDDLARRNGKQ